MPEKIKEIRSKNEETFKYSDDSHNQSHGTNLMSGNINTGGASNYNAYFHNSLNYTTHQSFYHHKISTSVPSIAENQSHDFEDFLNLVIFVYIYIIILESYFIFSV